MLKFITGNKNKFKEVKEMLLPFKVEQVDVDLDEIQELDEQAIIEYKLFQAAKRVKGSYFVEDSSVYFECFNYKFPGPFIRWYHDAVSVSEQAKIAIKLGKIGAIAKTIIGFSNNGKDFKFFNGSIKGKLVLPRGTKDFGYGPIFQPNGFKQTYGEMDRKLKHEISGRGQAIQKLKNYLIKQKYL
jgi:inosine triphosphate pyrophosphatase